MEKIFIISKSISAKIVFSFGNFNSGTPAFCTTEFYIMPNRAKYVVEHIYAGDMTK